MEFAADPRIPIRFNKSSGQYTLIVNAGHHMIMTFCPRCGEKLNGDRKSARVNEQLCKHLPDLSRKRGSSIKYRRREQEFWLLGRDSLTLRLFYCPLCGNKLPLQKDEVRFYRKSPAEVAKLAKQFQKITTVDHALKQFGPPDIRRGPILDYFYPKGKRTPTGYKRALFYNQLAKTVTVVVIELLGGKVEVKFYPKEKPA